jgi:hypothetical protein
MISKNVIKNKSLIAKVVCMTIVAIFVLTFAVSVDAAIVPCTGPNVPGDPSGCDFQALGQLVNNVITEGVKIAIAASAIAFAWAGLIYITANGDSGKISKAHNIFRRVLIGIVLVMSAFLILDLILTAFRVEDTVINQINRFLNTVF